MTGAVIVAAGSGRRFGGGERKQFLELGGIPVLEWAVRAFRAHDAVGEVVVVLPGDVAAEPPDWLLRDGVTVAAGGPSRSASVARGLVCLPEEVERILVHDGVRPFASAALIGRVAEHSAPVIPVLPVTDTVKQVDGAGRVVRTLDRSRLVRVQTPQGFPAALLRSVHAAAGPDEPSGTIRTDHGTRRRGEDWRATDDAALCEVRGHEVRTVPGEDRNLKITSMVDYEHARSLVTEGLVRPASGGRARTS